MISALTLQVAARHLRYGVLSFPGDAVIPQTLYLVALRPGLGDLWHALCPGLRLRSQMVLRQSVA